MLVSLLPNEKAYHSDHSLQKKKIQILLCNESGHLKSKEQKANVLHYFLLVLDYTLPTTIHTTGYKIGNGTLRTEASCWP